MLIFIALLDYESGRLVVVDFCSGGGHLGIVLAHLLREENATVCLVENKEESLRRAHRRVKLLGNKYQYDLKGFILI